MRKKVIEYQSERISLIENITQQRAEARQSLLKALDPILKTYMTENQISLVVDKKNIVMGNAELDITNIIVEKLNKSFPSLNLK